MPPPPRTAGARFLLLPALVLVAFLDNFAQLPVLAPLAVSLGADAVLAGLIVGAYSLSNLVGNVVAGPVLDRRGPIGPLVLGLAATAVVLAGYAIATTPMALLGVRILHGATAATIVPAVFVLAGQGSAAGMVGRMGALGAMIGLAAMIGPPVSGIVASRSGIPTLYLGLSGIFAAGAVVTALVGGRGGVGQPRPTAAATLAAPATLASLLRDGRRSGLLHQWMGGAALVFAVSALSLLLPLALAAREGERAMLVAGRLLGVFSVAATAVMLAQARLRRQLSPSTLALLGGGGLLAMALALGGLALSGPPVGTGAALLLALLGLGYGTTFPSLAAGVTLRAPPGASGRAQALFYAFFSAGAFLGPLLAGVASRGAPGAGYLPALLVTAAVGGILVRRTVSEGRERMGQGG
jgi:MFS family permease